MSVPEEIREAFEKEEARLAGEIARLKARIELSRAATDALEIALEETEETLAGMLRREIETN